VRVSIVNCVSTAADLMKFSDQSLMRHSGHVNFDYVVVKWLASPEVEEYLKDLPRIARAISPVEGIEVHVIEHQTDPSVGYVPNLRGMMNDGFHYAFGLNAYAGLVNTDCYFGPDWLQNLVKYAEIDRVVNSIHITRTTPPKPAAGIITEDLGVPLVGSFKFQRFVNLYDQNYQDSLYTAPRNDYRQCATMPYLFHRRYWERCGPWELTTEKGTPDVRFFDRVAAAGARFALSRSSIVYHHEAVERRGKRPPGAENLPEE